MLELDHRARRETADHILRTHSSQEVTRILETCHPEIAGAIRRSPVWNGYRRPLTPVFHTHRPRVF